MKNTTKPLIAKKQKKRFTEIILVSYKLNHLRYKEKIQFYYALKGRDGKTGMLKLLKAKSLSKSVLLLEKNNEKEIQTFLEHWHCSYIIKTFFMKNHNG